jgi:hypothetical protein
MQSEDIKKFIETKVTQKNNYVKIEFSKRPALYGIFIVTSDFGYLSSKNFWRVVTRKNFDEYKNTKSGELARIYNGAEFSKLSLLTDEF